MLSTALAVYLLGAGLQAHSVHGRYTGAGLGGPEVLELWTDGQARLAAKPGSWHPRAGTLVWEGGQATWSIIGPEALVVILPDGSAVAFRIAKLGPGGAALPETRGKAGFFELAARYTAIFKQRPARLLVTAEGKIEFCAQLGPQKELAPVCHAGTMEVIAGEIVTGSERIPFTMTASGDVALATGTTLDVGEYKSFRRDPLGTVP